MAIKNLFQLVIPYEKSTSSDSHYTIKRKKILNILSMVSNRFKKNSIYVSVISSMHPKTIGVDYSCIEYMRNFI